MIENSSYEIAMDKINDDMWYSFGVGLSHELRSYIFVMASCINQIREKSHSGVCGDIATELELLADAVETVQSSLNAFFDIAKGKVNQEKEEIDIREHLKKTISSMKLSKTWKQCSSQASINIVGCENKMNVIAIDIFTIAYNLIKNSLEAFSETGIGNEILIEVDGKGFHVLDNGPGIDAIKLRSFRTTKSEGSGLGIAISSILARRNGMKLLVGEPSTRRFNTMISVVRT